MTKWLKSIMGEALFKQSAIVFIGTIFVNVANLVFWLYMVRALTPADYATLNSLIALMALFSVPLNITQIVITRYVSKFIALDRQIDVIALVSFLSRIISLILIPIFFFFVFFSSNIGDFLKIKAYGLIFLSGMGVVFGSFSSITMGALSGLQRFKAVSLNSAATGLTKLSMGISLVSLKMGVLGALLGFVSSLIFSLFFSLFQLPKWLKDFWKNKSVFHLEKKDIFNYFIPVGLSTLCFFLLTNTDIILVKHFFSPADAGYYSVAQTIGKIVLFVPGAIGVVMFPKIVETHSKKMNTLVVLKKCLWAVGFLSGFAFLLSLLFPNIILNILTGHSQPEAVSLVKYFALSMTFFALVNILMIYHLSLHNMKFIYFMLFVSLLQLTAISLLHSSLEQVLIIMVLCSVLLFSTGLWMSKESA